MLAWGLGSIDQLGDHAAAGIKHAGVDQAWTAQFVADVCRLVRRIGQALEPARYHCEAGFLDAGQGREDEIVGGDLRPRAASAT